jgi:hypothetical protein
MAFITEDIDELLRKENLELIVFTKMNPELSMLGLFEKKNNNGKDTFAFARDETTAEQMILDGIMKEPVEILEASELPEVKITGINKNVGKMRRIGFQAVFTEESLKDNINYDKIQKTIETMAYSIARTLNRHAYQILIQAAAAPTITLGDGAWDDDNEEIDNDVKKIQRAFADQEGYNYDLTDMYVSKNAYWAAEDWYEANRNKGFNPNDVRGMNLHRISELDSGLLGMDMGLKPAKWYYNVYSEDNLLHDKYGSFIHINRVDELKGHKIPRKVTIQMYVEYGFAVLEPKAVVFEEGI